MTIGKKIASLRAEKDISQVKLAEDIGVSRSLLYKWESDSVIPSNKSVQKLSEYFGVPYSYFYDEPTEPTPSATAAANTASTDVALADGADEAASVQEKEGEREKVVAELKQMFDDYAKKNDITKIGMKDILDKMFKEDFIIRKRVVLIILSVLSVISAVATVYLGATIFPIKDGAEKIGDVSVLLIVFICAVIICLGLIIAAVCVKIFWKWKSFF